MPGVEISKGRAKCEWCKQVIAKGEKRFWALKGEYYGRPEYSYWHPKCFLESSHSGVTGRELIEGIIETFLPLLIGEDASAPVILALRMGK
jgi:hypothetical protein